MPLCSYKRDVAAVTSKSAPATFVTLRQLFLPFNEVLNPMSRKDETTRGAIGGHWMSKIKTLLADFRELSVEMHLACTEKTAACLLVVVVNLFRSHSSLCETVTVGQGFQRTALCLARSNGKTSAGLPLQHISIYVCRHVPKRKCESLVS